MDDLVCRNWFTCGADVRDMRSSVVMSLVGVFYLDLLGVLELLAELFLEGCLQGYLVHKKQPPPP